MKAKKLLLMCIGTLLIFMLGLIALLGACAEQTYNVTIMEKEGIGQYLADADGVSLYFTKDDFMGQKCSCTGECLDTWPIFYKENIETPPGASAWWFKIITREDGEKQTTFKDFPLYYYVDDKAPGDTNGHGVNDVWMLMTFLQ